MNFLDEHYGAYDEDGRLLSRHGQVEYRTTMKYILDCLQDVTDPHILEVGAGTGRYSVTLAKQGYRVTAVEMVEHNLNILKAKLDGSEPITVLQGNALDLSVFASDSFDLTMVLGPMYHLYTKEDKLQAMKLLDRVATAYGAFDPVALEDALLCWEEFRKARNYQPSDNEALQIAEAADYLKAEKTKQERQRSFQRKLDSVSMLIDNAAPLEEVERCFAEAEAFDPAIPESIANRVAQYRLDVERERRTAAILKGCRIMGATAIVAVILVGSGILTVQHLTESRCISGGWLLLTFPV